MCCFLLVCLVFFANQTALINFYDTLSNSTSKHDWNATKVCLHMQVNIKIYIICDELVATDIQTYRAYYAVLTILCYILTQAHGANFLLDRFGIACVCSTTHTYIMYGAANTRNVEAVNQNISTEWLNDWVLLIQFHLIDGLSKPGHHSHSLQLSCQV